MFNANCSTENDQSYNVPKSISTYVRIYNFKIQVQSSAGLSVYVYNSMSVGNSLLSPLQYAVLTV